MAESLKVIINASNIKYGGGLQVATSIISSLLLDERNLIIHYVVSHEVYKQLSVLPFDVHKLTVVKVDFSNPFSFIKYFKVMKHLECEFKPDVFFSIFGPTYHEPKEAKHLVGFANAWLVQPNTRAYEVFSNKDRFLKRLKNKILGFFLFNKKNHYVTESISIADDFCKYFRTDLSQISVVNNCLSHYFTQEYVFNPFVFLLADSRFKFVTITHNYPHKNLKVIPLVGKILQSYGFEFVFVVTLSSSEYDSMSDDFKKYTINVGPVSIVDCPKLYDSCDALFLPTLIECFSVSYLEAMYKRLPIATSDLAFAREVCPNETYYFDPYDYLSISSALMKLITENSSKNECKAIKVFDQKVVSLYGSNETRVDKYVNLMRSLFRG